METYFMILANVLAILVTLLIGWQIYSYFVMEKKMREVAAKETKKLGNEIRRVMELNAQIAEKDNRISVISLCNVIVSGALRNDDYEMVLAVDLLILNDLKEHYDESHANSLLPSIKSFIALCVESRTELDSRNLNKLKQGLQDLAALDRRAFDLLKELDKLLQYARL